MIRSILAYANKINRHAAPISTANHAGELVVRDDRFAVDV